MILHTLEDLMPLGQVSLIEVSLSTGIKDFDVRPLEALQILFLDNLLECLGDEQGVPFLRSTISAVLLSIRATHVDFFLSTRDGVHLQSRRANILGA